jgi:hypothetical protein
MASNKSRQNIAKTIDDLSRTIRALSKSLRDKGASADAICNLAKLVNSLSRLCERSGVRPGPESGNPMIDGDPDYYSSMSVPGEGER